MKKIIFTVILTIHIFTVFSQKNENINFDVRHVTNQLNIDGHQMFYALPKNIIQIKIEVTKTIQYEGPYSTYAPKYLNISEGIIPMDNEFYTISNIKCKRISIPDTSNFYCITTNRNFLPIIQLNSDGVILGYNTDTDLNNYKFNNYLYTDFPEKSDEFYFTDLGVKPFLRKTQKTFYKTIKTDSSIQKIPVKKQGLSPTSVNENAAEAAAFIRKLRKRRMKLLFGIKDETFPVEAGALQTMVDELNKYEKSYLELFMGKTIEQKHTYYIYFEPDVNSGAEQKVVGWFSERNGFTFSKKDSRKRDIKPLIVDAYSLDAIPAAKIQVMNNSSKTPIPIKYGLYYRIPGRVVLSIKYLNKTLLKQAFEIAQKGQIVPLPVEYLNNPEYSIEFYPETGALKRINKLSQK